MNDLSDLHGVFPTALRWNAEIGFLAITVFNSETGEREFTTDRARPAGDVCPRPGDAGPRLCAGAGSNNERPLGRRVESVVVVPFNDHNLSLD